MKIAQIVSTFPPYKGGIGNVAYDQAEELAKLGHEITVFTPCYGTIKKKEARPLSFKIRRIKPWFKFGNAAFTPQLFYCLKDFDAVHLHYPFFGGAEAVWLAKFLKYQKAPLVLQYHMDVVGWGFLKHFFSFYRRIFLPLIVGSADQIIVSSSDYARNSDIKDFIEKKPEKFMEIPLGVDSDFFKPSDRDPELASKYNLRPNDKIILFVGGLDKAHYFKGIDVLLKAFASIKSSKFQVPSSKLIIVGGGNLRPDYERMAGDLGIADSVVFAGSVSDGDLPKHYNLADIFVLPSVDKSEAFGLVLLEAMACGKPVVASDLPGVRTVTERGGLLVEPKSASDLAEKIKYLLENDAIRKELGERGRGAVEEKYSWKKIALELEKTYGKIER